MIVGTCGNCGGVVQSPDVWHGIYPPTPSCVSCGSRPARPHGSVIPMGPHPTTGAYWPSPLSQQIAAVESGHMVPR